MLAIRLARTGKKHQAYFRIVVSDSRKQPTAKFVEILGNYDPHLKKVQIKKDRLEEYLKNGAQPSNSVAKLLKSEKIELPKWVKIAEKKRAPKKAVEEKAEEVEGNPSTDAQGTDESAKAEAPAESESEAKEEAPAETTEVAETEKTEEAPAEEPKEVAAEEAK